MTETAAAAGDVKPRRMLPSERRDDLIAATLALFGRKPHHKVTPADIVAEAGVSRALFYRYFSSMDELNIAALEKVTEGLTTQLLPPEDEPLVGQVRHAIHELFSFAKAFPTPYIALVRRGPGVSTPGAYELVEKVRTDMIDAILVRARAESTPYLLLTVRSWIGLLEGTVLTWLTDRVEERALPRHELEDWLLGQLRAMVTATAEFDSAAADLVRGLQ
jgi:AcrR family transcriptional regulator